MENTTAEKTPTKFVMLQKKLQEIESDLPIDPTVADHVTSDDIKERFAFLEKIRAAEGGPDQSPRTTDQFRDIDERIARLKAAFFNDEDDGEDDDDEDEEDAPSICSDCTMQTLPVEEILVRKEEEEEEKEAVAAARKWRGIGKYCGAFGGGVVVGAVWMVFHLFCVGCVIRDDYHGLFIHPT